ncbi:MAG: cytochrome-ba3 oxidase subunit [Halobacteriaceae archaeon]
MDLAPRVVVGIALLALVPVVAFAVLKPATVVWLSAGCVVVIAASLFVAFGPVNGRAAPINR